MNFFRKVVVCKLFCKTKEEERIVDGTTRNQAITEAKKKREEAEERIKNMVAQINGCGDRWFLEPRSTIDECAENNNGS